MVRMLWGLVLTALTLPGCHGGSEHALGTAKDRLVKIGRAYLDATDHLGRPPQGFSEIRPYFYGEVDEAVTRSPNDGEEFVVLWGVDYNTLPLTRENPFTVAAYEKHGDGGKRYVLRIPTQVLLMSDAELAKAVFPPGHQPPQ